MFHFRLQPGFSTPQTAVVRADPPSTDSSGFQAQLCILDTRFARANCRQLHVDRLGESCAFSARGEDSCTPVCQRNLERDPFTFEKNVIGTGCGWATVNWLGVTWRRPERQDDLLAVIHLLLSDREPHRHPRGNIATVRQFSRVLLVITKSQPG